MSLRLSVQSERCVRSGACRAAAPSLFATDDRGRCRALVEELTDANCELARRAESACEVGAIKVIDDALYDFPNVGP